MPGDSNIDGVVNSIRQRIREGVYIPGQRLPTERELAEEMNVSRQTMRTALKYLQSENAIYTIPKSGIFVRRQGQIVEMGPLAPAILRPGSDTGRVRIQENQGQQSRTLSLLHAGIFLADTKIAEKMNVEEQTELLRRSYTYAINTIPYRIVDTYHSLALLDQLPNRDDDPLRWLRTYVDSHSEKPPEIFEKIRCRMPGEDEADVLHINRNQPVFDREQWIIVNSSVFLSMGGEKVFGYTHIIANAALHELTYSCKTEMWEDFVDRTLLEHPLGRNEGSERERRTFL